MELKRPMLAVAIEDTSKIKYPVWASIKLDGCFSRSALVTTNKGLIPIGEIVDKRLNLKALSYNEATGKLEFKKIVNYFNNGTKTGMTFKGDKVTNNHKFYVNGEWSNYEDIDGVSVLDNSYAQSVLIGMLLGDSCPSVEKRRDSFTIRLTWSVTDGDLDFGETKADLFRQIVGVSQSNRVSGFGSEMKVFTTSPLNGKGFEFWHLHNMGIDSNGFCKRKVDLELKDIAPNFTDLSLAIWYFDDGTLSFNNGNEDTPRIHFSIPRYSEKTQETFKRLFKHKYGVVPTIARYGKDVKMSFSSADSVYLLYRMARVASGMLPRKFPKDMQYGIIPKPISEIGLKFEQFQRERGEVNTGFIAYDIEVEDNHNYFCNGALVHNCRAMVKDSIVYSRSMKPIPSKAVQELFGKPEYNGMDGELVYGDMNAPLVFNKTTSFCMSKEVPEGMDKSQIRYFVFDKWDEQGNWEERIGKAITGWPEATQVHRLRHHLIQNEGQLLELEANVLGAGGEGLIVRSIHGEYKQGRSTLKEGLLLKLKRFQNSECVIIGFEEKMHNANEAKINETGHIDRSSHKENLIPCNTLGALVVTAEPWGEFRIGTGFNDEQRKEIWENRDKYIGQLVSFDHFTVGAMDKPRFPSFKGIRWEGDV